LRSGIEGQVLAVAEAAAGEEDGRLVVTWVFALRGSSRKEPSCGRATGTVLAHGP